MVNAPPCAACSWTLRWMPEQNGWGCDRCRQFYPSGSPQLQQPGSQPMAQAPSPYAPQVAAGPGAMGQSPMQPHMAPMGQQAYGQPPQGQAPYNPQAQQPYAAHGP